MDDEVDPRLGGAELGVVLGNDVAEVVVAEGDDPAVAAEAVDAAAKTGTRKVTAKNARISLTRTALSVVRSSGQIDGA